MTGIDPQLLEQLSAWMDGELPADEARFLQRRLGNDRALREQWERWQVASACLRSVPVRAMDPGLSDRIALAIAPAGHAVPGSSTGSRAGSRAAWFASAAALVLAVVMLPGILAVDPRAPAAPGPAPVALELAPPAVSPTPDAAAQAMPPMSPLPSVRDFPLAVRGGQAWPRSPLRVDAMARDAMVVRGDAGDTAPFVPAMPEPSDPRKADEPSAE